MGSRAAERTVLAAPMELCVLELWERARSPALLKQGTDQGSHSTAGLWRPVPWLIAAAGCMFPAPLHPPSLDVSCPVLPGSCTPTCAVALPVAVVPAALPQENCSARSCLQQPGMGISLLPWFIQCHGWGSAPSSVWPHGL